MSENENTGASFSAPERPIRVLMADDEETLLRVTVELLKNEGMVCEHVSDGTTAVEMVRRAKEEGNDFDVVVADYKMPGLDGIQMLDAVHSECPDTRVIILTGYPSVSSAVRSLKGRAIDYITKPFDVQYLVSRVREAAEHRRLKMMADECIERNRLIVETAEEGVWFVDRIGRTEFVNAKMADLLGYSVEEMQGLPMQSFMDCERHPDAMDVIPGRLRERGQHEICFQRKDKSALWTIVNTSPAMGGGGDRIGTIVMVTDISNRKRTDQALKDAESFYRTVADFTYDWEYWVNPDGTLRYVSPACKRITGYAREELIADPNFMQRMVLPEDMPAWVEHSAIAGAASGRQEIQIRIRHRDGGTIWIEHACQPVVDEKGKFLGHRASNRDVTERRRTQKSLQEARRLESLSVLAGGIAHDFNNLLQGMLGYAELARRNLPENSPEREMIEEVETAGRRAAHLSGQMLAYSGKGIFLASRIDMVALVATQADALTSIASPHGRLKSSFLDNLPPVMADAGQLTQVLLSLATNAAESYEKGGDSRRTGDTAGLITIRLSVVDAGPKDLVGTYLDDDLPAGRYVRLDVIDNGCGMDAETVSRVFDPFFTTKFQGRGLGMAAALGIVRGHKGVIHLDSEVGRGTTARNGSLAGCRAGRGGACGDGGGGTVRRGQEHSERADDPDC